MPRRPPRSPLFPYTTLFRSQPILLHREAKIHSIAAHPHETRVAAGEEMNFDFALRLRGSRGGGRRYRSEEHTSELQSRGHLVCRLLLEKKNNKQKYILTGAV